MCRPSTLRSLPASAARATSSLVVLARFLFPRSALSPRSPDSYRASRRSSSPQPQPSSPQRPSSSYRNRSKTAHTRMPATPTRYLTSRFNHSPISPCYPTHHISSLLLLNTPYSPTHPTFTPLTSNPPYPPLNTNMRELGCDAGAHVPPRWCVPIAWLVAASKHPGTVALMDRAGASSSPRVSSPLDVPRGSGR